MKKQHKERLASFLDRINAGEFDNPIVQVKKPAQIILETQIQRLLDWANALSRAIDKIPHKTDLEWLDSEIERQIRFRIALEKTFGMKDHNDLHNAALMYDTLVSLVK